MSTLLSVEDLHVRFRTGSALKSLVTRQAGAHVDAVCGVSFAIRRGETLAVVGESGSGKSTVARTLMGLVTPSAGTISFHGEAVEAFGATERRAYRRHVAMMFQDPVGSLSPRLTVRSLLVEPFRIHRVTDVDAVRETDRLLDMVGLSPAFAQRYPHQLSGGQARRVGIARALALRPDLVIADEPTAGLDVSVQGEVLNLLGTLQDTLGIAILIITHNLNIVRHISDRMAIMYLGRFLETGPTDDIFAAPRHPYTQALLSANPKPDPDAVGDRIDLGGEVPSPMNRPAGCEFHPRCAHATEVCRRAFPQARGDDPDQRHVFHCHNPI